MFAIKVAILLLIFFGLAATRFAVKISEAMPSNHMLGTTAIFMLFVDIGINASIFYSFIKGSPYIKLSALLGLVIICKFVLTIVLSHFVMKFCLAAACRTVYRIHTGNQYHEQFLFQPVTLTLSLPRPSKGLTWVEPDDR